MNSFVSLAEQGYFDNTPCHRLTTAQTQIYVLQCGDPTGTGTGGPGYTIPDELTGTETYPPGTLAMANTGQPDSGGSQFFIVYQATTHPPNYTVFGHISPAGVKAVQKLAAKGTDNAFGEETVTGIRSRRPPSPRSRPADRSPGRRPQASAYSIVVPSWRVRADRAQPVRSGGSRGAAPRAPGRRPPPPGSGWRR